MPQDDGDHYDLFMPIGGGAAEGQAPPSKVKRQLNGITLTRDRLHACGPARHGAPARRSPKYGLEDVVARCAANAGAYSSTAGLRTWSSS
jgi:hypothetical protein